MGKRVAICVALVFAASPGGLRAQSLADILKGVPSREEGAKQVPAVNINIDALYGVWNYSGAAVEFTGNDLVAVLGSSMAAPVIRENLETYYARAGVVQGSSVIEFRDNDTYIARTASSSVNGTYSFDAQCRKILVAYDHPELGGSGTIEGRLVFTEGRLMMTFEAEKVVRMIRELTDGRTLDRNIRDLMEIISEYKGLYLGFELER